MRKPLGVPTDAQLPETLRNMQIKVVDSDARAPPVVQANPGDPAVLEIQAKLLAGESRNSVISKNYSKNNCQARLRVYFRNRSQIHNIHGRTETTDDSHINGSQQSLYISKQVTIQLPPHKAIVTEMRVYPIRYTVPFKGSVTVDADLTQNDKYHSLSEIVQLMFILAGYIWNRTHRRLTTSRSLTYWGKAECRLCTRQGRCS